MDNGAETLNETIWFNTAPTPPYEQLSPIRQNACEVISVQQVSWSTDRNITNFAHNSMQSFNYRHQRDTKVQKMDCGKRKMN